VEVRREPTPGDGGDDNDTEVEDEDIITVDIADNEEAVVLDTLLESNDEPGDEDEDEDKDDDDEDENGTTDDVDEEVRLVVLVLLELCGDVLTL